MRGNYSSSDYETVGIIEIRVKEQSGGKGGGGWQFVLNGQRMKRWQVKVSNLKGVLVGLIPINGQGTRLH